jgi:hypothetical protein
LNDWEHVELAGVRRPFVGKSGESVSREAGEDSHAIFMPKIAPFRILPRTNASLRIFAQYAANFHRLTTAAIAGWNELPQISQ